MKKIAPIRVYDMCGTGPADWPPSPTAGEWWDGISVRRAPA